MKFKLPKIPVDKELKNTFIGLIVAFIYKLYTSTFRYHVYLEYESDKKIFFEDLHNLNLNPKGAFLYAFWHQDELACIPYFAFKNICVLVSKSKDGTIMATLAKYMGYATVRGSSSRGAVAGLMASLKMARKGYKISMAVDGPRGPIYKAKDGLPKISQKTNHKIVPFKAVPHNCWTSHKSWNKIRLPKPFSRVDIVVGKIDMYTTDGLENKLIQLDDYSKFHYVHRS
jgi:lysophospholipid acyltransferase (LPLAT)-like uncharacterized protein